MGILVLVYVACGFFYSEHVFIVKKKVYKSISLLQEKENVFNLVLILFYFQ